MVLEPGNKIHVITRRNFDDDLRRHFAGQVLAATDVTARVEGFVFVHDPNTNVFVRRKARRTRIVSLVDANNLINVLPTSAVLEDLAYRISGEGRLVITDGKAVEIDINEFGRER